MQTSQYSIVEVNWAGRLIREHVAAV